MGCYVSKNEAALQVFKDKAWAWAKHEKDTGDDKLALGDGFDEAMVASWLRVSADHTFSARDWMKSQYGNPDVGGGLQKLMGRLAEVESGLKLDGTIGDPPVHPGGQCADDVQT